MTRYAENTQVSSEKSRAEMERTIRRYGASGFMYGWGDDEAIVGFQMESRRVQFRMSLPDPDADEFTLTDTGKKRSESQADKAWEQACRQRWRALSLVIKAKLEAVESGITTFEEEFMAHIVLPDGKTVGAHMIPQIERSYQDGKMPPMLPGPGGGRHG